MAKRRKNAGKRVGPRAPIKRDYNEALRLLNIFGGNLNKMVEWFKEEIVPSLLREDFDNFVLSGVAMMEETTWKYQRSPEAKRLLKQPNKLGERMRPITREEWVRAIVAGAGEETVVNAAGQKQRVWRRKELGANKEAVIKRITRKDRARGGKYKARN
jgi:hypothetical protein